MMKMPLLNKKILVFIAGLILIGAVAYYLAAIFKDNNDVQKPEEAIQIIDGFEFFFQLSLEI